MAESSHFRFPRFWFWIAIAATVAVADQLSKWAVIQWLATQSSTGVVQYRFEDIFPPILRFQLQYNPGAAFSFLADAGGWQRWFFVSLASAVSVAIVYWLWTLRKSGPAILEAGLALVLGGAIGNLIDRVQSGAVTDFIQVRFADFPIPGFDPFPSFNLADAAITVGAILLIIDAFFVSGRAERALEKKKSS